MKAFQILFGAALVALLFGAQSAQAIPAGTCDLVLDFKLTAYMQQSTNVNDPPGSDTYKSTVAKIKITTADLIELIAIAAGQPLPPAGTRLALYRDGFYEGSACLLDPDGNPVLGNISTTILAEVILSAYPYELLNINTATGSRKLKAWRQMTFNMTFLGGTAMQLTGFATEQAKTSYATGLSSYSAKINVGGPGTIDGATTFFLGKVSGKGTVGIGF